MARIPRLDNICLKLVKIPGNSMPAKKNGRLAFLDLNAKHPPLKQQWINGIISVIRLIDMCSS